MTMSNTPIPNGQALEIPATLAPGIHFMHLTMEYGNTVHRCHMVARLRGISDSVTFHC